MWAVVNIVGPFSDRGIAHGTVPSLSLTPPVVGAPGGINGVCLDEIKEGSLLGAEVGADGVGSVFVPAICEAAIVFLPV